MTIPLCAENNRLKYFFFMINGNCISIKLLFHIIEIGTFFVGIIVDLFTCVYELNLHL